MYLGNFEVIILYLGHQLVVIGVFTRALLPLQPEGGVAEQTTSFILQQADRWAT